MENLQRLYKENPVTLVELSRVTKISTSTIHRYVTGSIKTINPTYYEPIMKALKDLQPRDKCEVENKTDVNSNNSHDNQIEINVAELKEQMNKNGIVGSNNYSTYTSQQSSMITPCQKPIRRGSVWYVKNNFSTGSEQAFSRPCLVVSCDKLNTVLDVYTVVYLTSSEKSPLPNHVSIKTSRDSIALCEQIFSVSRNRFVNYLTDVTSTEMEMVDRGIMMTFGLPFKQQNINDSHDYLRLQVENRMLKDFNETLLGIAMK